MVKIFNITGFCVICGSMLFNTFPEDFPNEWKFCCSCFSLAYELIKHGFNIVLKFYYDIILNLEEKLRKINKCITLVNNGKNN